MKFQRGASNFFKKLVPTKQGAEFLIHSILFLIARAEKYSFWCWTVAAGAFFLKKQLFNAGTLPQAPFFVCEKLLFGTGTLPQAPFFSEKLVFLTVSQEIFF